MTYNRGVCVAKCLEYYSYNSIFEQTIMTDHILLVAILSHLKQKNRENVSLPLFQNSIVILPVLFKLCDFALVILK